MRGNTETPDSWKFVRIVPHDPALPTHDRVLCSWYGGFAGSNSWKLSSGNEKVIDRGHYLEVPQHSGTVYYLHKSAEHVSSLMMNIFLDCNKHAEDYKLEMFDYEPA